MKKASIILLIIMLASFTVSIVLLGIQLQNIDELKEAISADVHQEMVIELQETVENIIIDSNIVNNINIYSTEKDTIVVILEGKHISMVNKEIGISVKDRPDSLHIEIEEKGIQKYLNVIIYDTDLTLNLYIPERYNQKLEIDVSYENVYIEESILNRLEIEDRTLIDVEEIEEGDDEDGWEETI